MRAGMMMLGAIAAVTLAADGARAASVNFSTFEVGTQGDAVTVGDITRYEILASGFRFFSYDPIVVAPGGPGGDSGQALVTTSPSAALFVEQVSGEAFFTTGLNGSARIDQFPTSAEDYFIIEYGDVGSKIFSYIGEDRANFPTFGFEETTPQPPHSILSLRWNGNATGLIALNSFGGFDAPNEVPVPVPVPLPASVTLLGAGLAGLAFVRRARPRRRAVALGVAAAVTLAAGGASAATMTFANLEALMNTYTEDGITASTEAYALDVGTLFADSGGGSPIAMDFTMAGRFSAESFEFQPLQFEPQLCSELDSSCTPYTYDNVRLTGYRDGEVVAEDVFDQSDIAPVGVNTLYSIREAFSDLDSLFLGFKYDTPIPPGFFVECSFPCATFRIDNVTLTPVAPVPLPATAGLLMAGLTGLGLMRRRRT